MNGTTSEQNVAVSTCCENQHTTHSKHCADNTDMTRIRIANVMTYNSDMTKMNMAMMKS